MNDFIASWHYLPAWFWHSTAFVLGACIGSFLNVVIYRLPKGRSVVNPGSTCSCGQAVRWFDNIPILSWLLLRGRARCCGSSFSVRYPLVELLTALLFLVISMRYFQQPLAALAVAVFVCFMVSQAFIDWDTMEIPDVFSVGGFFIGLLLAIMVPALHGWDSGFWLADAVRSFGDALIGGLIGSALLLWIALGAEAVLRKEAMGFGDVKLMGAIGAFCGWQGAVFAIFGGAVLGMVGVLFVIAFSIATGRLKFTALLDLQGLKMPFGPALGAGAVLYLLFLQPLVDAYFADFAATLTILFR